MLTSKSGLTLNSHGDKTEQNSFFTGITPCVILMYELEQFKYKKEEHIISVVKGITDKIYQRNIGGQAFQMRSIIEEFKDVQK